MNVAAVQLDIVWENKPANHDRVRALLDQANVAPGTLVVLPEMFATGFSMNVAQIAEGAARETQQFLASEAEWRGVYLVGGVVTVGPDGRGRNEAVVFAPNGTEQARYQKMHPFTYGGESNHYGPGRAPMLFRLGKWTVAPFICYDLRFPEIFRVAARQGADLFLVIANWPEARVAHWTTLLQARAIENQACVVGVNRVGDDPTPLHYSGRSLIIDARGDILADAGATETVLSATLDHDALLAYRRQLPFLADMRPDYLSAET